MRILRQNPHSIHRDDFPANISAREAIWWNATQETFILERPDYTYGDDIFINAMPADEVHGRVSVFDFLVGEEGGVYAGVDVPQSRGTLVAGFKDINNYFELRTFTRTDLHDPQGWSAIINNAFLADIPTPDFPQATLIPPTAGNLPTAFDFVAIPMRRAVGQRFILCRAWDHIQLVQIKEGAETILAEEVIPHQLQQFANLNQRLHMRLSIARQSGETAKIIGCYQIADSLNVIRHFFVQAEVESADCGDYCGAKSFWDHDSPITFRCLDEFNTRFVPNNRKPASEGNDFGDRHSDQSLLSLASTSTLASGFDWNLQWLDASAGESAWRVFPTLYHGSKASQSVLVEHDSNWPSWSMVPQAPRTTLTLRFRAVPDDGFLYNEYRFFRQWLPESVQMTAVDCGTDLVFYGQVNNHTNVRNPRALNFYPGAGLIIPDPTRNPEYEPIALGPTATAVINAYLVLSVGTQFSKSSNIIADRQSHNWVNNGAFQLNGLVSVFQPPESYEGRLRQWWESLGFQWPDDDGSGGTERSLVDSLYSGNPTIQGWAGWNVIESTSFFGTNGLAEGGLWSPALLNSPKILRQSPVGFVADWYRPGSGTGTGAGAGSGSGSSQRWFLQNWWIQPADVLRNWPFGNLEWWIEPN